MRKVEKNLERVAADILKELRERVKIPALIKKMYCAFGCISSWYGPESTDDCLQEKIQNILGELHSPRSEEFKDDEMLDEIV